MKFIITQKQSVRLIKEALGVPKPIEFWVDTFSALVKDGLMMLLSSEDREVFFEGGDVQDKSDVYAALDNADVDSYLSEILSNENQPVTCDCAE